MPEADSLVITSRTRVAFLSGPERPGFHSLQQILLLEYMQGVVFEMLLTRFNNLHSILLPLF